MPGNLNPPNRGTRRGKKVGCLGKELHRTGSKGINVSEEKTRGTKPSKTEERKRAVSPEKKNDKRRKKKGGKW